MYPILVSYLKECRRHWNSIPKKRQNELQEIADYIREKRQANKPAKMTFICTHNSRRSHLAQIWAAVSAHYLDIDGLETYSGGTEATAFNTRAVAAVKRAGCRVIKPEQERVADGENPRYRVHFDENEEPLICFSKTFDDAAVNPRENFAAIMTCSHADEHCPFVPGAEFRLSIPYQDPKESDGTDREQETYDERCRQIATEMFFMMSLV